MLMLDRGYTEGAEEIRFIICRVFKNQFHYPV
jgi:hypothetical protein